MERNIKLLVATEDVKNNVLNAAISAYQIDMDTVEIYTARAENVAVLHGLSSDTRFIFPVPGSSIEGFVLDLSVKDEDDLKLLNDALDYYFKVRPDPSFAARRANLRIKKKFNIDLIHPGDLYVRTSLPIKDPMYEGEVVAFFGYRFRPSRDTLEYLKKTYPVLVAAQDVLSLPGRPKKTKREEKYPGAKLLAEKLRKAREGKERPEPPSIEDIPRFDDLLYIFKPSHNQPRMVKLDCEMISAFAGRDEDVSPFVKTMSYSKIMTKDDEGRFRPSDEILEEIAHNFGNGC